MVAIHLSTILGRTITFMRLYLQKPIRNGTYFVGYSLQKNQLFRARFRPHALRPLGSQWVEKISVPIDLYNMDQSIRYEP